MLLFTAIKRDKILIIEDAATGNRHYISTNGEEFFLGYTHSVLLTPVEEYFFINEDFNLELQRTIYESFGVGLPYEQADDAEFEIIDGKFLLYISREFTEINLIISNIPDHYLSIDGKKIELYGLFSSEIGAIKIYSREGFVFNAFNAHEIIFPVNWYI